MKLKKLFTMTIVIACMSSASLTAQAKWEGDAANGYWYSVENGTYLNSCWFQDADGTWYYFDENGYMKTGWLLDNGQWYYLNNGAMVSNQWMTDQGISYYFDANGCMIDIPLENPNIIKDPQEIFQITLPDSWTGLYTVIQFDTGFTIKETMSYKEGFGGNIFSIGLHRDNQYREYPNYRLLGSVTYQGIAYDIIVTMPTDVQFSIENKLAMDQYLFMSNEVDSALSTLTFADGAVFIKGISAFSTY